MPTYVTSAFKYKCLKVNNTGFEMLIYVTHAFKCVRLQVINTSFEMPRYTTHALQLATKEKEFCRIVLLADSWITAQSWLELSSASQVVQEAYQTIQLAC